MYNFWHLIFGFLILGLFSCNNSDNNSMALNETITMNSFCSNYKEPIIKLIENPENEVYCDHQKTPKNIRKKYFRHKVFHCNRELKNEKWYRGLFGKTEFNHTKYNFLAYYAVDSEFLFVLKPSDSGEKIVLYYFDGEKFCYIPYEFELNSIDINKEKINKWNLITHISKPCSGSVSESCNE